MKITSYIFIVGGVLLLIGLFFFFKPKDVSPAVVSTKNTKIQSTKQENVDAKSNKKVFPVVIEDGKIVSGEKIISVKQGEEVSMDILGDTDEEIHLHGYDISVDINPGEYAKLEFVADKTGRFSFELEHAGVELGYVEVHPK